MWNSPTVCLTMIVKNESNIITRLFDSLVYMDTSSYFIDTYCICDTGSTDDTIKIIEEYFDTKNIPGKIIHEPFQHFSYNRNVVLRSALGMSDYLLLMDADMVLNPCAFDKKGLCTHDTFSILQGTDDFYYKNIRIVKNNGQYKYKGVTHEYICSPPNTRNYTIPKTQLFIRDIGDGGCKYDKFDRDIKLLTTGIQEEPDNDRYYFYLANSYHDTGNYTKAIETYQKRIEMGGWSQEIWYSYYRTGICYKKMDDMSNAIHSWLTGYDYLPERLEGLYEIIQYYRIHSNHKLCLLFYNLSMKTLLDKKYNIDEYLFLHKDVYAYELYYEYTIFAAYLGVTNINNEVVHVLNRCNNNSKNINVLKNLKYYKDVLNPLRIMNKDNCISVIIKDAPVTLQSSSSCLIPNPYKDGYIMNIRYVNYNIMPDGSYENCDKHIITANKCMELDTQFTLLSETMFEVDFQGRMYTGIEDLRLYHDKHSHKIRYIGTGYHKNNTIGIVEGQYKIHNKRLGVNEMRHRFHKTNCEKNWVYIEYNGETHIVYKWQPLQICKISEVGHEIRLTKSINMPKIFTHVRGSSCGFTYNKETWFVVHLVSYESPRHYYHMTVVLSEDAHLIRHSAPFTFEGECIEYCLSIIVEEDRVLMNYSTWDRTTRIGVYDKKYIDSITKY